MTDYSKTMTTLDDITGLTGRLRALVETLRDDPAVTGDLLVKPVENALDDFDAFDADIRTLRRRVTIAAGR